MKNFNLDDYIDWKKIVKDYSLESGDLSLHDTLELESILKRFIETNRAINFNLRTHYANIIDADDCIRAIDDAVNGETKPPTT